MRLSLKSQNQIPTATTRGKTWRCREFSDRIPCNCGRICPAFSAINGKSHGKGLAVRPTNFHVDLFGVDLWLHTGGWGFATNTTSLTVLSCPFWLSENLPPEHATSTQGFKQVSCLSRLFDSLSHMHKVADVHEEWEAVKALLTGHESCGCKPKQLPPCCAHAQFSKVTKNRIVPNLIHADSY